jgi:hypothetical protein
MPRLSVVSIDRIKAALISGKLNDPAVYKELRATLEAARTSG